MAAFFLFLSGYIFWEDFIKPGLGEQRTHRLVMQAAKLFAPFKGIAELLFILMNTGAKLKDFIFNTRSRH